MKWHEDPRNIRFNELFQQYSDTPTDELYNEMFIIAYGCAQSLVKKHYPRLGDDIEDVAMEATIDVMERVRNGYKRKKQAFRIDKLPPYLMCWVHKRANELLEYRKRNITIGIEDAN